MKSQMNIAWVLLIPVFYIMAYAGFLTWLRPDPHSSFGMRAHSKEIAVVTGNREVTLQAVEIFKPAMRLHAKLSKRPIRITAVEGL